MNQAAGYKLLAVCYKLQVISYTLYQSTDIVPKILVHELIPFLTFLLLVYPYGN
jgi:hypothetical protein